MMEQVALDKPEEKDIELAHEVKKIDWGLFLRFGWVKVQVKEGKPTLVIMEKTVKLT